MSHRIPKLLLLGYMLGLVLFSGGFTILARLINTTRSRGEFFSHPFFLPLIMVVGDVFCIFLYVYEISRARKRYGSYQLHPKVVSARTKGRSTMVNPLQMVLPRFLNICGSCVLALSYSHTGAFEQKTAVTKVLRMAAEVEFSNETGLPYISFELALALQGIFVLIIAAISRVLLKRNQYLHHGLGILLIIIATCLITVPLYIDEPQTAANVLIGTGLVLASVILFSLQFNLEERLMSKYFLSPARLVGWEGVWGILLLAFVLPGFQFVKCTTHFCANGTLQDSVFAFKQMGSSVLILVSVIGMLFLSAFTNMFGVTVMKYTSGSNRASFLVLRLLPTWIFFIVFRGTGHQSINYIQVAGYALLFIGTIIYNEVVTLPFFGLNENTREKLDLKDQEAESSVWDEETTMSVRSSIHYNINI